MTGVLYGLARFCVRRRFVVVAVWVVVAIALVAVSHRMGDQTNDNLSLPGTNSQKATDALGKSFSNQANGTSPIVLHAPSGKLTDSKYANAVNEAASDLSKQKDVASVVNPLTSQGASALSKDKTTGYLSVTLSVPPGSLSVEDAQHHQRCSQPGEGHRRRRVLRGPRPREGGRRTRARARAGAGRLDVEPGAQLWPWRSSWWPSRPNPRACRDARSRWWPPRPDPRRANDGGRPDCFPQG